MVSTDVTQQQLENNNPHPDEEYRIQRRPDYIHWTPERENIWSVLEDRFKGEKFPEANIGLGSLADQAGCSRRTVKRLFEKYGHFEFVNECPGNPDGNRWKIHWDFKLNRKRNPGDDQPCSNFDDCRFFQERSKTGDSAKGVDTPATSVLEKKNNNISGTSSTIDFNHLMFFVRKECEKIGQEKLTAIIGSFFSRHDYWINRSKKSDAVRIFFQEYWSDFLKKLYSELSSDNAIRDLYVEITRFWLPDYLYKALREAEKRHRYKRNKRRKKEKEDSSEDDLLVDEETKFKRKKKLDELIDSLNSADDSDSSTEEKSSTTSKTNLSCTTKQKKTAIDQLAESRFDFEKKDLYTN